MDRSRANVGLFLIVLVAALAALRLTLWLGPVNFFTRAMEAGGIPIDPITRYERRFDCLRDQLDPGEIVGFAAAVDLEQFTEYYLLTQYTLAPVLVANAVNHPVIVGFFPPPDGRDQIAAQGLEVLLDCDSGAYLLAPGTTQ